MSQMTIYLDDDTDKLLKAQVKASGDSVSKWIAGAIKQRVQTEWPPQVLALLGSWKDSDFPDIDQLRQGYGEDSPREKF